MYSCPNCGGVVYYGEHVCPSCGMELDWSAFETPPAEDQYQDYGQEQQWGQPPYDQQQYDQQQWEQPGREYRQAGQRQQYPPGKQLKSKTRTGGKKDSGGAIGAAGKRKKLVTIIVLTVLCIIIAGAAIWIGLGGNPFAPADGGQQNNGATPATGNETTPTQSVAGPIEIKKFVVSPGVIPAGEDSTLTWEVTGADVVRIDNGIGTVPPSGSQVVKPPDTTTYKLTASNESGSITATTTLSVNVGAPVITFTASPDTIVAGGTSTLTWNVSGASTVKLGHDSVEASGTREVSPAATTTYTLTATNSKGVIEATATVSIGTSGKPVITSFSATPDFLTKSGDPSTLDWFVTNASSVSINQGVGTVGVYGSKEVKPEATTTYALTATNSAGSTTMEVTVTVSSSGKPVISRFTASPPYITTGKSSTLQWAVAGATAITIDQGIGTVQASGTQTVSPGATTVYTLTATNNNGPTTATATVNFSTVTLPVIASFEVNPSTIPMGNNAILTWDVTGANQIEINNGIGSVPTSGSRDVSPTATTNYIITATNEGGSVTDNVTLSIY